MKGWVYIPFTGAVKGHGRGEGEGGAQGGKEMIIIQNNGIITGIVDWSAANLISDY